MKIEYGRILTRAWNITWKHKVLWLFGFLVALVSEFGSNGSNALNLRNQFSSTDFSRGSEYLPPELRSLLDAIEHIDWTTAWVYIGIAIGCLLIFWIVLTVLSIIGQGGLIKGILKADSEGTISIREAWAFGLRYFWRLFVICGLEFLIRLVIALMVFLMIFLPLLLILFQDFNSSAISLLPILILLLICPVYCCMFAIVWLLSFYMYFTKMAVLAEDLIIGAAFRRAFQAWKSAIGPILIIGLIIFALSLGVSFLSTLVAAPAIGLFLAALWPLIAESGTVNMMLLYGAIAMLLITIPIGWLISSVWVTWQNAVYTLVYRQITVSPLEKPIP